MSVGLVFLKIGLSVVLNAAMLVGVYWAFSKKKPQYFTGTAGVISPNRTTVFILVMIGFFITSGGLFLYNHQETRLLSSILILGGTIFFVGSLLGFSSGYHLTWNKDGVSGLSRQFTLKLHQNRTFITWDDIITVEENRLQNYYIESTDGRKIFWNFAYDGDIEFQKILMDNLTKFKPS